ncbi:MAG TPA: hypothetical protein VG916_06600 [Gemmatimonadaceae bacterium]|nr:hypothetical protein [Gemmatimonadaceae bacterium]
MSDRVELATRDSLTEISGEMIPRKRWSRVQNLAATLVAVAVIVPALAIVLSSAIALAVGVGVVAVGSAA